MQFNKLFDGRVHQESETDNGRVHQSSVVRPSINPIALVLALLIMLSFSITNHPMDSFANDVVTENALVSGNGQTEIGLNGESIGSIVETSVSSMSEIAMKTKEEHAMKIADGSEQQEEREQDAPEQPVEEPSDIDAGQTSTEAFDAQVEPAYEEHASEDATAYASEDASEYASEDASEYASEDANAYDFVHPNVYDFGYAKHAYGDLHAHDDGSINEWEPGYFVLHGNQDVFDFSDIEPGDTIIVDGVSYLIEGYYDFRSGEVDYETVRSWECCTWDRALFSSCYRYDDNHSRLLFSYPTGNDYSTYIDANGQWVSGS